MADIPQDIFGDPTLMALDQVLEAEALKEEPREYLGASIIGDPCSRKLWYYMNRPREVFKADTLRRFIDGHRTEDLIVGWLKQIPGITVWEKDENGEQYGFSEGNFSGHYDGVILGILQSPKTPHVLEIKCCNSKKFEKLKKLIKDLGEKKALAEWDPIYYAQAQVYMKYTQLDRHYMVVATPGGRDLISCRTEYDAAAAKGYINKAHRILTAKVPPERMSEKSDFFMCKWCNFRDECHGQNRQT